MDLRTYRKDCLLGTLGALLMLVGNLCLTEGMAAFMPVYKLLGGGYTSYPKHLQQDRRIGEVI